MANLKDISIRARRVYEALPEGVVEREGAGEIIFTNGFIEGYQAAEQDYLLKNQHTMLITFEGSGEGLVTIKKNDVVLRECHAVETPYPAFILETSLDVQQVQPFLNPDNGTWCFAVALTGKRTFLAPWTVFFDESENGESANLNISCPDDTTITWLKDEA